MLGAAALEILRRLHLPQRVPQHHHLWGCGAMGGGLVGTVAGGGEDPPLEGRH